MIRNAPPLTPMITLRAASLGAAALLCTLSASTAIAQGTPPTGPDRVFHSMPFVIQSDGFVQRSSRGYMFGFQGDGHVYARFTASAAHCSSIIAHIRLDGGPETISYPLAAAQVSSRLDLGVATAGPHQVTIVGEGVPGGCNVGRLSAWGGSIEVTLRPVTAPPLVPDAGDWFVEILHRGDWRPGEQGCIVTAAGAVFTYRSDTTDQRAADGRHGQHYDSGYFGLRLGADYMTGADLTPAERQGFPGFGARLRRAASGRLVSRLAAYDAGETTVTGWFRTTDGGYQAVTLDGDGDRRVTNTSSAAGETLDALRAVARPDCRFPPRR